MVGQGQCAGQRGTKLEVGRLQGCLALRSAAGALPAWVGAARQEGWVPLRAGGVLSGAALMGTEQAMMLSDAGRGGTAWSRGAQRCTGLREGLLQGTELRCSISQAKEMLSAAQDRGRESAGSQVPVRHRAECSRGMKIPGATHYGSRLLGWRCRLVRMAREEDARCQGRGQ